MSFINFIAWMFLCGSSTLTSILNCQLGKSIVLLLPVAPDAATQRMAAWTTKGGKTVVEFVITHF